MCFPIGYNYNRTLAGWCCCPCPCLYSKCHLSIGECSLQINLRLIELYWVCHLHRINISPMWTRPRRTVYKDIYIGENTKFTCTKFNFRRKKHGMLVLWQFLPWFLPTCPQSALPRSLPRRAKVAAFSNRLVSMFSSPIRSCHAAKSKWFKF